MKRNITKSEFVEVFKKSNGYEHNFNNEQLDLLFITLNNIGYEALYTKTGVDVVNISCNFKAYTKKELVEDYLQNTFFDIEEHEDEDENDIEDAKLDEVLRYLNNYTKYHKDANGENFIINAF